ncbi:hypothetical protein ACQ859_07605 [Roseateles chitinivorans]|uniref:hypothetical protein n=1 Tax=Roseateles chitinivorans TaxID=2917965 RepID=UPI003D67FB01
MTPVRSTSRRATARRFSLVDDARWVRVQRAALSGGVAAAIVAALRQAGVADGIGIWAATALAAVVGAALPVRTPARALLRWDGAQWWWQRAGEPLAVTPGVVIDLEQWMLLRLNAATDADGVRGRAPPERWIALSRRAHEAQWASLRLHLFLAAA